VRSRVLTLVALIAVLGGIVSWRLGIFQPGVSADTKLGAAAPALPLKTLDGKDLKLDEYRRNKDGKPVPVIIAVWSYECPSGRSAMGRYAELAKAAEAKGAKFIGVCAYGESPDELAAYARKNGIAYTMAYDEGAKAAKALGAQVVTATFVIDADGKLVYKGGIGGGGEKWPEAALDEVLAGKPVSKAETKARG